MRPQTRPSALLTLFAVALLTLVVLPRSPAMAEVSRQDQQPFEVYVYPSTWSPMVFQEVSFNGGIWGGYTPPIIDYSWTFGDGATSSEPNPKHTYTQLGQFEVTLTVMVTDGSVATGSVTVSVQPISISLSPYRDEYSVYHSIGFYVEFPTDSGPLSCTWEFGDGVTVGPVDCGWGYPPVMHRYAADGTYRVQVTMVSTAGWQTTATREVLVSTHDVGVARVQVPKSARVNQSRDITVSVSNSRQDESQVMVDLYITDPNADPYYDAGFRLIASSLQYVPALPRNRTTDITFSYTFTPQDAALGKVNFKVKVSILGHEDVKASDNEYISLPVTVR